MSRLADGYEPSWDIDREYGRQGELFVQRLIESLGSDAIEVKTDRKVVDTKRLYIETECLGRNGWSPRGITTSSADYWAFVAAESAVFILPTQHLRAMLKFGSPAECKVGSHPTRGIVFPWAQAMAATLHVAGKLEGRL